MDDICRMKIFHSFTDLVHNISVMQVLENLLTDGIVKISFHELKDEI